MNPSEKAVGFVAQSQFALSILGGPRRADLILLGAC